MKFSLTPKMRDCLKALRELTVDDVAPTYEELRVHLGLASKSGVHRLIWSLRARGYLTQPENTRKARCVTILGSNPVDSITLDDLKHAEISKLLWLSATALAVADHRTQIGLGA